MQRQPTCLVADDHPAMVEALVGLLTDRGIHVVARVGDGEAALAKLARLRPSIAVLDVRLPGLSGIEVTRRAVLASPPTAVVLYTAYGDSAVLMDALDAGARGLVLKDSPLPDLVRAVETVLAGGTYVDPVLAGGFARRHSDSDLPDLTRRERDVLRLLADGLSNEEIGRRLFLSPETVRTHVRKAMRKLDANTRTQAVAEALRRSLIN
ncbi:MAG TPA: response regulator transcription factor [Gaiellaceae bacterium]|nr:response regulator transcription factor [Gaiellaceae bacterium]